MVEPTVVDLNDESPIYEEIGREIHAMGKDESVVVTIANNGSDVVVECAFCGSSSSTMFMCDMCMNKIFCLTCDDRFHRHSKRSNHSRKRISFVTRQVVDEKQQPVPVAPPRKKRNSSRMSTRTNFSPPTCGESSRLSSIVDLSIDPSFVQHDDGFINNDGLHQMKPRMPGQFEIMVNEGRETFTDKYGRSGDLLHHSQQFSGRVDPYQSVMQAFSGLNEDVWSGPKVRNGSMHPHTVSHPNTYNFSNRCNSMHNLASRSPVPPPHSAFASHMFEDDDNLHCQYQKRYNRRSVCEEDLRQSFDQPNSKFVASPLHLRSRIEEKTRSMLNLNEEFVRGRENIIHGFGYIDPDRYHYYDIPCSTNYRSRKQRGLNRRFSGRFKKSGLRGCTPDSRPLSAHANYQFKDTSSSSSEYASSSGRRFSQCGRGRHGYSNRLRHFDLQPPQRNAGPCSVNSFNSEDDKYFTGQSGEDNYRDEKSSSSNVSGGRSTLPLFIHQRGKWRCKFCSSKNGFRRKNDICWMCWNSGAGVPLAANMRGDECKKGRMRMMANIDELSVISTNSQDFKDSDEISSLYDAIRNGRKQESKDEKMRNLSSYGCESNISTISSITSIERRPIFKKCGGRQGFRKRRFSKRSNNKSFDVKERTPPSENAIETFTNVLLDPDYDYDEDVMRNEKVSNVLMIKRRIEDKLNMSEDEAGESTTRSNSTLDTNEKDFEEKKDEKLINEYCSLPIDNQDEDFHTTDDNLNDIDILKVIKYPNSDDDDENLTTEILPSINKLFYQCCDSDSQNSYQSDDSGEEEDSSERDQGQHETFEKRKQRNGRFCLSQGWVNTLLEGERVAELNIKRNEYKDWISFEEILAVVCKKGWDVDTAKKYFKSDINDLDSCKVCFSTLFISKTVQFPICKHECCIDCMESHLIHSIRNKSINLITCPFCDYSLNLNDHQDKLDETERIVLIDQYFEELDKFINTTFSKIGDGVIKIFRTKNEERLLSRSDDFMYCHKCGEGFVGDRSYKIVVCPKCRAMSCAKCDKPWLDTHWDLNCEQYAKWLIDNDMEKNENALKLCIEESGLKCPSCKFDFVNARGGCIHCRCTNCGHHFCRGCRSPFKESAKCGSGCYSMGLHAHHPRNCFYYLRDKDPLDLESILKKNGVKVGLKEETLVTNNSCSDAVSTICGIKCKIMVQKEKERKRFVKERTPRFDSTFLSPQTLKMTESTSPDYTYVDEPCSQNSLIRSPGYCREHYIEYLCGLIRQHNLEPAPILDLGELERAFRREKIYLPPKRPGEFEYVYRDRLAEVITTQVPLAKL